MTATYDPCSKCRYMPPASAKYCAESRSAEGSCQRSLASSFFISRVFEWIVRWQTIEIIGPPAVLNMCISRGQILGWILKRFRSTIIKYSAYRYRSVFNYVKDSWGGEAFKIIFQEGKRRQLFLRIRNYIAAKNEGNVAIAFVKFPVKSCIVNSPKLTAILCMIFYKGERYISWEISKFLLNVYSMIVKMNYNRD